MRKLISASKRKWVLGGILGFAAVALTTTGFATWIVGVKRTSQQNDIGVSVDTATNSSIQLDTVLDTTVKGDSSYKWNTIQLTESDRVIGDDKLVKTGGTGIEVFKDGLKIKFSSIKIQVGAQYGNLAKIKGIDFSFDYTSSIVEEAETNTNRANLVSKSYIASGASSGEREQAATVDSTYREYISAPESISFGNSDLAIDTSTGLYTYEIKNHVAVFKWGSYFNGKSPANFYNDIFKNDKLTIENGGKVTSELGLMNTALNGKTLKLTAKIFEDTAA